MTPWRGRAATFSLVLLLLLGAALPAMADTVSLRTAARVPTLEALTLADVADLEGDYAASFAALTFDEAALERVRGGAGVIEIADVRRLLDAADANWGELSLRGDACTIRLRSTARERNEAVEPVETGPVKIDPNGPPTLRLRVAKYISQWTELPLDRLRLTFSEHQVELLALSEHQYRFELTPIMSPDSLRIPVVVRVWEHEVPIRQETVTVDIEKRVPVVVLKNDLDRDAVVNEGDVEVRTIWLSQSGATPHQSLAEVMGRVASKRLHAGAILRSGDLEQPILISRRDKVRVYCLVGNLVLSTDTARAMEDGRLGEWIQLQREGSRRTFSAKVQGRGVALVELPEPVIGEEP
jgi:flagella basal body P-ring formation protein FlgA